MLLAISAGFRRLPLRAGGVVLVALAARLLLVGFLCFRLRRPRVHVGPCLADRAEVGTRPFPGGAGGRFRLECDCEGFTGCGLVGSALMARPCTAGARSPPQNPSRIAIASPLFLRHGPTAVLVIERWELGPPVLLVDAPAGPIRATLRKAMRDPIRTRGNPGSPSAPAWLKLLVLSDGRLWVAPFELTRRTAPTVEVRITPDIALHAGEDGPRFVSRLSRHLLRKAAATLLRGEVESLSIRLCALVDGMPSQAPR